MTTAVRASLARRALFLGPEISRRRRTPNNRHSRHKRLPQARL